MRYRHFKDSNLYWFYKSTDGKTLKQAMVLEPLRKRVTDIAHSSIIGAHMGVEKDCGQNYE